MLHLLQGFQSSNNKRAEEVLKKYEKEEKLPKTEYAQTSLFDLEEMEENKKDDSLKKEIESLNVIEMTPMDAINYLYNLKEKIKEDK